MIYILIGIIVILLITIFEEVQNNKNLLKKFNNLKNQNDKKDQEINKNKKEIEIIKNDLKAKDLKISKLENELSNYTQIKNDSLNLNDNLFITGKAGTGKSYLLKYFRKNTTKKVLYCAPTGIAALNIDGVTLHSAFGWNNLTDEHEIKLSSNKLSLLKSLDTLIINSVNPVIW